MGGPITGPSAMPLTEAERIKRLERIVDAARNGGGEDREIVEILEALTHFIPKPNGNGNGNGWASKVLMGVLCPLVVAGIVGGVVLYGEVRALKAEIQQCQKVKP